MKATMAKRSQRPLRFTFNSKNSGDGLIWSSSATGEEERWSWVTGGGQIVAGGDCVRDFSEETEEIGGAVGGCSGFSRLCRRRMRVVVLSEGGDWRRIEPKE